MTPSELFAFLGAPLSNVRWSWGSVRDDGAVFLRVWQDGMVKADGKRYALISRPRAEGDGDDSLGYRERLGHARLIRDGARCYLIMCVAADPTAEPRTIASFNQNEVFRGGAVLERDSNLYIELSARIPVVTVRQRADA